MFQTSTSWGPILSLGSDQFWWVIWTYDYRLIKDTVSLRHDRQGCDAMQAGEEKSSRQSFGCKIEFQKGGQTDGRTDRWMEWRRRSRRRRERWRHCSCSSWHQRPNMLRAPEREIESIWREGTGLRLESVIEWITLPVSAWLLWQSALLSSLLRHLVWRAIKMLRQSTNINGRDENCWKGFVYLRPSILPVPGRGTEPKSTSAVSFLCISANGL